MKYLFTNKNVHVGDICKVLCTREQIETMHIPKYLCDGKIEDFNSIGIYVIRVSETRCLGYLVHYSKDSISKKKVQAYKMNGKRIFIRITTGNNVGLLKYC